MIAVGRAVLLHRAVNPDRDREQINQKNGGDAELERDRDALEDDFHHRPVVLVGFPEIERGHLLEPDQVADVDGLVQPV